MLRRLDDLSIGKKGLLVAGIPTLVGVIFFVILGFMYFEVLQAIKLETQSKDILFLVQKLGPMGGDALQRLSRYIVTRDKKLIAKNKKIMSEKTKLIAQLESQLASAPSLSVRGQMWVDLMKREFNLAEGVEQSLNDSEDYLGIMGSTGFKRQMQGLYPYESESRRNFIKQLSKQQRESQTNITRWNEVILNLIPIALGVNVALGLLLAVSYSRAINRRLAALVDTATRLTTGTELLPTMYGRDELGRLDRMFHSVAMELQEAAQHQKAIVENAVDVICSVTDDARIDAVNSAATRTWGYAQEELIGKDIFGIVHGDDATTFRSELKAIASGKLERSFESRVTCKDGSVIHVSWAANWLDDEKKFYLVAHDITQRKLEEALLKESEQTVRLVFESMPVGVIITDESELIELTNLSAKQMLGYRETELRDQPIQMLLADEVGREEIQFLKRLHDAEGGSASELMVRRKDSDAFPAELATSEFVLNDQRKVLVVLQDITMRHEMERLKKEFVAMVSHDLRTPLTTILGSMQLLQEGPLGKLNEKGKEHVKVAEGETERLINLVNTLLDIEKFEAGQMEIHKEPINVATLVSHSLNALESLAEKSQVELVSEVKLINANADKASLTQVLINLLSNAIKFSPPESKIVVSAKRLSNAFEVRIKDEGRGVPEALQEAIFERFKQVDVTDRTEKKGSGLGLSICKLIVEAHGGAIGVDSVMGEGSTFWFRIPLK